MSVIEELQPEEGYKDIFSPTAYIDTGIEGDRALIHMLYVPPHCRGNGIGKSLAADFIESLPKEVTHVRLKAASLGSGDTLPFWKGLGFTSAYISSNEDNERILVKAVNDYRLSPPEHVSEEDEMHYIFD